ncbi:MAG: methionine--tRNA ligase, partial [Candidatus Binataceae bacterium]
MARRIHITTAIFYCNGTPHVGSAYEALAADVFARYQRKTLGADRVTFLTGTDEHGDKIRRAALAEGLAPKAYTDRMSGIFREVFAGLNIRFDYFVRTTDPAHEAFVRDMLTRTREHGDIYFKDYEGLYCVDCERFYTEKELIEGRLCPSHNRPLELISEGNYFLRIEKYREQVVRHIKDNPDFIRPDRYRNEALNMLSEPLADLCISRPKSRLEWGIELPFDSRYVTYVWYDAFWAYVSEPANLLGLEKFQREVWPSTEHFIGKDILKTHIVYWPAMLYAAGFEHLFRHLNVHGWMNFGGSRMSKSSGNVRDPVSYERAFGPDVLRYFVMRELVYGLDGDFSEERMVERYNADLANDLGNLVSRVLSMAQRYCGGEVIAAITPSSIAEQRLHEHMSNLERDVDDSLGELAFNRALERIWARLDTMNKY